MIHYSLFIFQEEVAHRYYGQEAKLFYLFVEHERARGEQKEIIHKQIEYITKPIPVLPLQQQLNKAFRTEKGYTCSGNRHTLQRKNSDSKVELILEREAAHLISSHDSFEEEMMFFEVLRKLEPTFFAFSLDKERYGWLKPIKQNMFLSK